MHRLYSKPRTGAMAYGYDVRWKSFSPYVADMQFRLTNLQQYLGNANPDANHSANPTTKYRCEYINLVSGQTPSPRTNAP